MFNKIVRTVLLLALLGTLTQAWFGMGDEKKEKKRGRKKEAPQGDYVERQDEVPPPQYDNPADRNRNVDTDKNRNFREKYKNFRKSKDRDEMSSKEYNQQVLADDKIEETKTSVDDGYLSDEEIHKLWAEHMHDFVPEDMLNLVVEKGATEPFFEEITHKTPTTVKGAYYVYAGSKEKSISCVVYDPNREILYKRKGSPQGIIIFETTIPGEYSVVFSN